ncbi:MAG: hypothetical protein L6290_10860 [Thermodesulfovibrionales bacterium]|nr:hypothetical protein [Thermodesulfovibrionales bacterium]
MNIYREFIDLIRIHTGPTPLERVLQTLGDAVDACTGAITRAESSGDAEYIDAVVDDECDVIENLLGAAFVACQADISAVISHVNRMHKRGLSDGHRLASSDSSKTGILALDNQLVATSTYSYVQVIDAVANYFKHRDEWRGSWIQFSPKSREGKTVAIITVVGAKQGSTGNMRTGVTALGISNYRNLTSLYEHIASWADNVATAYESELRSFNLI